MPAMGQQFSDLAVFLSWQPSQYILQIGIRIMPIELGLSAPIEY